MNPMEAVNNLHSFAEQNNCNGPTRDILRQSAQLLASTIQDYDKLKASAPAPSASPTLDEIAKK